jgi:hypothetical protein
VTSPVRSVCFDGKGQNLLYAFAALRALASRSTLSFTLRTKDGLSSGLRLELSRRMAQLAQLVPGMGLDLEEGAQGRAAASSEQLVLNEGNGPRHVHLIQQWASVCQVTVGGAELPASVKSSRKRDPRVTIVGSSPEEIRRLMELLRVCLPTDFKRRVLIEEETGIFDLIGEKRRRIRDYSALLDEIAATPLFVGRAGFCYSIAELARVPRAVILWQEETNVYPLASDGVVLSENLSGAFAVVRWLIDSSGKAPLIRTHSGVRDGDIQSWAVSMRGWNAAYRNLAESAKHPERTVAWRQLAALRKQREQEQAGAQSQIQELTKWATSADAYAKSLLAEVEKVQAAREHEQAEAHCQVEGLTRWATTADAYAKSLLADLERVQAAREHEQAQARGQVEELTGWATTADAYAKSLLADLEKVQAAREQEQAEARGQVEELTKWATTADTYAKSLLAELGNVQEAWEQKRTEAERQIEDLSRAFASAGEQGNALAAELERETAAREHAERSVHQTKQQLSVAAAQISLAERRIEGFTQLLEQARTEIDGLHAELEIGAGDFSRKMAVSETQIRDLRLSAQEIARVQQKQRSILLQQIAATEFNSQRRLGSLMELVAILKRDQILAEDFVRMLEKSLQEYSRPLHKRMVTSLGYLIDNLMASKESNKE